MEFCKGVGLALSLYTVTLGLTGCQKALPAPNPYPVPTQSPIGGGTTNGQGTTDLTCRNSILPGVGQAVFPEDLVDGQSGQYRLVQLETYVEAQAPNGIRANYDIRAALSPNTSVTAPNASVDVLCFDLRQAPAASLQGQATLPIAIARRDGYVVTDLLLNVTLYGPSRPEPRLLSYESRFPTSLNLTQLLQDAQSRGETMRFIRTQPGEFQILQTGEYKDSLGVLYRKNTFGDYRYVP